MPDLQQRQQQQQQRNTSDARHQLHFRLYTVCQPAMCHLDYAICLTTSAAPRLSSSLLY
jgi:hypothetical protein